MSQWSASHRDSRPSTPASSPPSDGQIPHHKPDSSVNSRHSVSPKDSFPAYQEPPLNDSPVRADYAPSQTSISDSHTTSPSGRQRSSSRPLSIVQTFHPPVMDVNEETLPELQPIFTFLNRHQNKLYQEGYFLKLDDQDSSAWFLALPARAALDESLILCRGTSKSGSDVDRVFRPAGRHGAVAVGCGGIGRSRRRRRSFAQVHQPDRRIHQDGTALLRAGPPTPPRGVLKLMVSADRITADANERGATVTEHSQH